MPTNRELFDDLLARDLVRVRRASLFDFDPGPVTPLDPDRVEGMLLGLAIGDALGATSESITPGLRRRIYGEIDHYLKHPRTGERRGFPTDDTQLAFWTLEQMLADDGFVPANVARRFGADPVFGLGQSVAEFLRRHFTEGRPWEESGVESAGNGALMRIAPILLPHLRTGTRDLWVDAALCAKITHDDYASTAACVAFVRLLFELLAMPSPPPPDWWRETWVGTARELEGETQYRPRGGRYTRYEGPLWRYVDERLRVAASRERPLRQECDDWHSAAYLMETMPSVLLILQRHGDDPGQAIVRAVNDTMDNDTIAAIVGAAVGALHGSRALPRRWVERLSGRTRHDDDGRVFELVDAARARWFGP